MVLQEVVRGVGKVVASLLLAMALFSLAAFASASSNSLIIGSTQEHTALNPWYHTSDPNENIQLLLNIGLTYFDIDGDLLPGLATEVPTLDNGRLRVTYDGSGNFVLQEVDWTLRDDAYWSDGVPITTDDVLFTYEVQKTPEVSAANLAKTQLIQEIVRIDDKNFTIVYGAPNLFSTYTGGNIGLSRWADIAPKHIWEPIYRDVMARVEAQPDQAAAIVTADFIGAPGSTGQDPSQVVTSGAFRFVEWVHGQYLRAERRDDFFLLPSGDPDDYVQEVIVRFIVNQPTLVSALISGEIDASDDWGLAGMDPAVLRAQLGNRGEVVISASGVIENLLPNQFNDECSLVDDLLLGDKRTRQALTMAIDREEIANTVYPGAIVSNSCMARGDLGFDDTLNPWPYDPAAASALLAELGWEDLDGDGWLERVTEDNRTVEFILHWQSTPATFRVRTSEILQEYYEAVGIKLIPRTMPGPQITATPYIMHGADCVWTGFIEFGTPGGLGISPADPLMDQLWANDYTESPVDAILENVPTSENDYGGINFFGYVSDEYDRLRAEALTEFDVDKRVTILKEMQRIFNEELGTIPLYDRVDIYTRATGLLNYQKLPIVRTLNWNAWEWGWEQNGAVPAR